MEEQLISFETAKLAKEKGFNEKCVKGYKSDKVLITIDRSQASTFEGASISFTNTDLEAYNEQFNDDWKAIYIAPTQSLLQKWLREIHKIHIIIFSANNQESWFYGVNKIMWQSCSKEILYNSYEEALEEGLQEASKRITTIKENKIQFK